MSSQSQTPSSTALPQASAYTPVQGARWMAKKGLRITPLRGKAPFLQAWQASATGDLAQVNAWQESWPDINFGCVAKKSEFWMLDEDVAGVVARFTAETGIAMDQHFRVESSVGAGRSHWYFRACAESDELLSNITQDQFKDGAASVRVNNEQCVCPFSVHPERKTPYLPVDLHAEIKVAPTEFIKWILDQRVKSSAEKASVDEDFIVPDGQRDNFLISRAGKLREAGAEYEEIYSALSRDNEKHCQPPKEEADIERISKSACRYKKGTAYTTTIGGLLPGQNVIPSAQPMAQENASIEIVPDDLDDGDGEDEAELQEDGGALEYPYWAWCGTLYEDFATIAGQKNLVAKEFFLEAVKTVVGAVCGHRITPFQTESQESRFYSIFISPGGSGKSSAAKWACDMFAGTGLVYELSQAGAYTNIGCAKGSFSSAPGLIKQGFARHNRILAVYDEATTLIEKCAVPGSGISFMDLVNQLFEINRSVPQSLTKESKDVVFKAVQFSLLGCTTEERWDNAFAKTDAESSGFFQRLNIVSNPSNERVADFPDPDLVDLAKDFVKKILPLEYQKAVVRKTPEASAMLEKWFASMKKQWQRLPDDVTGRIQVMVQRNACHIAWLLSGDQIPSPEKPNEIIEIICDEDVMARAIALAEYEVFVRQLHRPITAENAWAKLECLIRRYMVRHGSKQPVLRGKLSRAVHANRFGIKMFQSALDNLCAEGFIRFGRKENSKKRGRQGQYIILVAN